ncbi:methyl-accepting chemotaxis protein [Ideonella sp. DXS29W]|uniref:Methyl-accepting chemotaxis protein n=1 Tax=Ideonella lacteola TaxID=2984193 RepID=A0ABU9BUT9_9BURK
MPAYSLSHLSIGRRLGLGFGLILALLVLVAAFGLYQMRGMAARMQHLVELTNAKSTIASQMMGEIKQQAIHVRNITLLTDEKEIAAEASGLALANQRYDEAAKRLIDTIAADTESRPAEQELAQAIAAAADQTRPLMKRAADQGGSGDVINATETLMKKARPLEDAWRAKVGELLTLEAQIGQEAYTEAQAAQRRGWAVVITAVAVALAGGLLVGWRITRGVQKPINSAIRVAERIAQGDLGSNVQVDSHDEIGRLLQALADMQATLRRLVGEIRSTAESIQVASAEVATGNMDLSQRTEQAASNLQRTSSSMEQLTHTVQSSADSASTANQLASSSAQVAARGGEVVSQVVSTMQAIDASSKRIGDIIGVIDGIAFQTNILALNAAVEAARAGEQGRGFAVVAGEVRSLAQRSAKAATEIKSLIGSSTERVEQGTRLVGDAGQTMDEIVSSVRRVSDIIGEITAASAEQSHGIATINASVTQLDQVTQQNAALVEQSAAAAESLREQAVRLNGLVSTFKLDETA